MQSTQMPDAKGKQAGSNGVLPPLPNPASGSANPAASLSSLWAYLTPALDHIVKSSTNNLTKAPSIDLEFYSGIHSSCYNYITSSSDNVNPSTGRREDSITTGIDLYDQLDRYFASTARELMLGSPQDDSTLIHYLVPCFNRYSVGAQSVNRLLNYVNRHYVKRAVDEDKGWLTVNDVLEHISKSSSGKDSRDKLSKKMKEKRFDELRKWGYHDGCSASSLASAEAAAEAATGLDRIVPLASLAHRRFRVEFVEPLLAIPKSSKKKKKNKPTGAANGNGSSAPPPPKGRLARAVKELLESPDVSEESRTELASGLAELLRKVGVRPDHPLRKKLEKYAPKLD